MKILTEEEQLTKRIIQLSSLIDYHTIPLKRARRRYNIKDTWMISFWIITSVSTLKYVYDNESKIHDQLYDYREILTQKRNNLNKK